MAPNFADLQSQIAKITSLLENVSSAGVKDSLRAQIRRLELDASVETLEKVTAAVEELQAERAELKKLGEEASDENLRRVLNAEIVSRNTILAKLEFEQKSLESRKRAAEGGSASVASAPTPTPVAITPVPAPAAASSAPVAAGEGPLTDEEIGLLKFEHLTKFAWDQSPKFARVYISLDGVTPQTRVRGKFSPVRGDIYIAGVKGKNYTLAMANLCEKIKPEESDVTAKDGRLLVRLRKVVEEEWSGLDDAEKKKKDQHQRLAKSGATTEELLANMYAQADDATRESLAKAAAEGQRKREEKARADALKAVHMEE